jgi:membrane protein YdbS with pleckstrin-like domain
MQTQRVDPNAVPVWRWQTALAFLVFSIPLIASGVRAPLSIWLALVVTYLVLATLCVWKAPPAYYRALEYGVDAQGITIHRGILWRSRIALPRIRVQHTDVAQGPLQRRYGIATLKLYTAGSRYTKIELSGLTHDRALALRDALLAGGGDSGV